MSFGSLIFFGMFHLEGNDVHDGIGIIYGYSHQ